jgi:hypothetical protein
VAETEAVELAEGEGRMKLSFYETDEVAQSRQLLTFGIGAFVFVACLMFAVGRSVERRRMSVSGMIVYVRGRIRP